MWIARNFAAGKSRTAASAGYVNNSADRRVSAAADGGTGQYALVGPSGFIYVPTKEEEVVLVQTVSGPMCIGVRTGYHGLIIEPGEIILKSAGGAILKLANDGKIYCNGREI
ncbi:MAG: hypothetical protein IJ861_09460 [Clostridia bacterium]|nr:hypothetical protein [Clostridia bacterium]